MKRTRSALNSQRIWGSRDSPLAGLNHGKQRKVAVVAADEDDDDKDVDKEEEEEEAAAAAPINHDTDTTALIMIASNFLNESCRHHPKPNKHTFNSSFFCIATVNDMKSKNGDCSWSAMPSGSTSEFYIDPMTSCIGDIDIMYTRRNRLAIPKDRQVPLRLPERFDTEVEVYEMIDTQFPCYVLLRRACHISKSAEDDAYTCTTTFNDVIYVRQGVTEGLVEPALWQSIKADDDEVNTVPHGPALKSEDAFGFERNFNTCRMPLDLVRFIRCPVWPPQADRWLTRPRKHGWPDKATIDCIVDYGCDVVQRQHPLCKHDEPKKQIQWRLSFSRAETILLNSWSPKQQSVYHLLRVFIKSLPEELVVTQRYHIKTLMLWTSELYPRQHWEDACFIDVCTALLSTMADWLKSEDYQMYFVQECNLYHNVLVASDNLISFLYSVTVELLTEWFVNTYVQKCTKQCPPEIKRPLNRAFTIADRLDTLSAVLDWRSHSMDEVSCRDIEQICYDIQLFFWEVSSNADEYQVFCERLVAHDERLAVFCVGVTLLHCARQFDRNQSFRKTAGKVVTALRICEKHFKLRNGQIVNLKHNSQTTKLQVNNAVISNELEDLCDLLKNTNSLMKSARHAIESKVSLTVELAKLYIYLTLRCKSTCNTCAEVSECSLHVYLACLHYKCKSYKHAADSCVLATTSSSTDDLGISVKHELLPQGIGDIDNVTGLILLYQFILPLVSQVNLEEGPPTDAFNVKLLAHYLLVHCLDAEHDGIRCRSQLVHFDQYTNCLRRTNDILLTDFLLYRLARESQSNKATVVCTMAKNCGTAKRMNAARRTQFDKRLLKHQLLQTAVKQLTAFRLMTARDFNYVRTIVITDYQALFAYKCGSYKKCLILSMSNIAKLMHGYATSVFTVPSDVMLLLDDECVSVIGLATLCNALDVDPHEKETVNQLVVSVYLVAQCKMKLGHGRSELIDVLSGIRFAHRKCHIENLLNRALMAFVYRKVVSTLL